MGSMLPYIAYMDPMGYNWRFLEAFTIRVKHQESPTPE